MLQLRMFLDLTVKYVQPSAFPEELKETGTQRSLKGARNGNKCLRVSV